MKLRTPKYITTIVITTLVVLVGLSLVPWNSATGNLFKDFNLFEDILPVLNKNPEAENIAPNNIDPELNHLYTEYKTEGELRDSIEIEKNADAMETAGANDSTPIENGSPELLHEVITPEIVDGVVSIESYVAGGEMLPKFKTAVNECGTRIVRVAVIGDSFIEGDILSADLRDILQERYGGCGVGYMAMHNDFPGFRKSVRQSDDGWTMHDIRNMRSSDTLRVLSGAYAIGNDGARSKFSGAPMSPRTESWNRSSILFIAPVAGSISITTTGGNTQLFDVQASKEPQQIVVNETTTTATIKSNIEGLISFGAYLDANVGLQLDCMSIRGNSGIAHRNLNVGLCCKLAKFVDYDLIILEFGINALSAEQNNYTPYMLAMTESVNHLKYCYPRADILILGISDRGSKSGTEIKSLSTCNAMIKAQRETARRTGTHFWDTRAAMGGENAIVDWRKRKLVNADYIHLNHDGGKELAVLLSKSLFKALDE